MCDCQKWASKYTKKNHVSCKHKCMVRPGLTWMPLRGLNLHTAVSTKFTVPSSTLTFSSNLKTWLLTVIRITSSRKQDVNTGLHADVGTGQKHLQERREGGMGCWIYTNRNLNLILLTWRIWWAPNNASRWQMGFISAFKGLNSVHIPATRDSN